MNTDWLATTSFAHRGLHGPQTGLSENSLSAFNAAKDAGFGFELDILLSGDDKAIVIHDQNLKRLTGRDESILNLTAEQLEKINFTDSDDTIPTLKIALNQTAGKTPILIEIKGDQGEYNKIAKNVFQDISDYNGPIAIMSFYPDIISYFKLNHPDITRGLVATPINDKSMPDDYFDIQQQIKTIRDLEVDFIAYDIRALPNKATQYCQQNNITVLTWTVRSEADRQKAKINTDNIIFEL